MVLIFAAQVSGLAGVWKKDPARSDDPQQKMQAVFQQMRAGGERHGGGMDGGMRGGGGMHGGGRGEYGRRSGGPMGIVNAPDELTLVLDGTELRVMEPTQTRVYTLDGEKHESETPNGAKLETTARLEGNAVSIEEKMPRGKVDRKFEVSPDGATLIVTSTVELDSMREPVVIKSVYVRPPKES